MIYVSNYSAHCLLDSGCVCKTFLDNMKIRSNFLDCLINDFQFITDNMEFDSHSYLTVDNAMKGENPDITNTKESFDNTVKKAKDLIPALIDYKAKRYDTLLNEERLYEFFVLIGTVLKDRLELIKMIDLCDSDLLKEMKKINYLIDTKIEYINRVSGIINQHVKEIIDYNEIDKLNSIVSEDGIMIDSYFIDIDILKNRLNAVCIVENKLNALINKLRLSGYEWASILTVPDLNNETP